MYRENKNGVFNASYGKRKFNLNHLKEQIFSSSLYLQNAKLTSIDFYETIKNVRENDLVFLDPPYSISKGIGFTKYNSKMFSQEDQKKVIEYIQEVKKRKAYYILTNEYNDNSVGLFRVLEDKNLIAERTTMVSAENKGRKKYKELIITNIP